MTARLTFEFDGFDKQTDFAKMFEKLISDNLGIENLRNATADFVTDVAVKQRATDDRIAELEKLVTIVNDLSSSVTTVIKGQISDKKTALDIMEASVIRSDKYKEQLKDDESESESSEEEITAPVVEVPPTPPVQVPVVENVRGSDKRRVKSRRSRV